MKRGNTYQELARIAQREQLSELHGITLEMIQDTFQRIGDYEKPVPRIGRPPHTPEQKLQAKIKAELKKGQQQIFEGATVSGIR